MLTPLARGPKRGRAWEEITISCPAVRVRALVWTVVPVGCSTNRLSETFMEIDVQWGLLAWSRSHIPEATQCVSVGRMS